MRDLPTNNVVTSRQLGTGGQLPREYHFLKINNICCFFFKIMFALGYSFGFGALVVVTVVNVAHRG